MKSACEKCGATLTRESEAYACSHECTFCLPCTAAMNSVCPNCGGALERRDAAKHGRVTNVEEKLAFVERHVEELDAVVRDLYDKMAGLRGDVTRVREEMQQGMEEMRRGPEDDVPPHSA